MAGIQHKQAVLRRPQTDGFADIWYAARANANLEIPTKTDIPLKELAPYMPNLSMFKYEPDGRAFYTLFGTELTAIFGSDLTGQHLGSFMNTEARTSYRLTSESFFDDHGKDAIAGHWVISKCRTSSGRLIELENLALPYREASDNTIRYIAYAMTLSTLDFGEGVAQRFPDTETLVFNAAKDRPDWLHLDPNPSVLSTAANTA